jgi:hypothetical protein
MEILRVPPYPLTSVWNLPDADYDYVVSVEDLVDNSIETSTITSDEDGVVIYEISADKLQLDRKLAIRFYDTEEENLIYESTLDIIRPYTNPNDLGTTPTEIREYKKWEIIARSIIDTYIEPTSFYNRKTVLQSNGSGSDYFPIWKDLNRVLKVYENDVLVYDTNAEDPLTNLYTYKVTPDKTAIYRLYDESIERVSSTPITLPASPSDHTEEQYRTVDFPSKNDYLFIVEEGPTSIPQDIQYATEMLIDDLKCGKLDYYQKYVTSYNTDQFKIQFDKQMLNGTGNLIVDKILDKYIKSIARVGVL